MRYVPAVATVTVGMTTYPLPPRNPTFLPLEHAQSYTVAPPAAVPFSASYDFGPSAAGVTSESTLLGADV